MTNTTKTNKVKNPKKDKKKKSKELRLTQNVDLREWLKKNGMPKVDKKKGGK